MGALEKVVKQLDADGALRRVGGQTYERTLVPVGRIRRPRIDEVTTARRLEQQAMVDYFTTTGLPDAVPRPPPRRPGDAAVRHLRQLCGRDAGRTSLAPEAVAAAESFLRKRPLEITPRKQYFDEVDGQAHGDPTGAAAGSRACAVDLGRRRVGTARSRRQATRRCVRRSARRCHGRDDPRLGARPLADLGHGGPLASPPGTRGVDGRAGRRPPRPPVPSRRAQGR